MSAKQRETLLKLRESVKKLTQNPPTTFSPQTGNVPGDKQYQPGTYPPPLPPLSK